MKKNPGRKDRRSIVRRNRTKLSGKKQAVNERKMLWLRRAMAGKAVPGEVM